MSESTKREENAPVQKTAKMTLAEMLYRALVRDEGAWREGSAAR